MIRTVVDQIYAELKARVLGGSWGLGIRIFEEEVASDLNVSRSAVREAIRLLEQEGLVVREPHRGLYVASPSGNEALEIAQVRAILEASAVRLGSPPSPQLLRELSELCDEMERLEVLSQRQDAVEVDRLFHARIVSVCTNTMLVKKFHELDGHIAIFFHWVSTHVTERLLGYGDRHRELLAAFALGDAASFEQAVLDHYLSAAADLVQNLPRLEESLSVRI